MRRLLTFFFLSIPAFSATFTVDAGWYTAGVFQSHLTSAITVTLSGAPSAARRFVVGFPMSNSTVLQVYIPTGMTGSCAGGTCNFVVKNTAAGGACDVTNTAEWPLDANGRVAVKMVGCGDLNVSGAITSLVGANTFATAVWMRGNQEGCQCIQGSYGPGPLTWRDNDTFMTGNEFHLANDGGLTAVKSDLWFYRNNVSPYWGAMIGADEGDGNAYYTRQQKFEAKGFTRATFEGNLWKGNFNDLGTSTSSILVMRNENQGIEDTLVTDNIFEHISGFFLANDLQTNQPNFWQGPPGKNFAVVNNVSWDVNEMGPGAEFPGSYDTHNIFGIQSGGGWLFQGPTMEEGLVVVNNTFPNLQGRIPTLFYATTTGGAGLVMKNNFLPVTNTGLALGLGARPGDTGLPTDTHPNSGYNAPPGCSGSGFPLINCIFPSAIISGNVIVSPDQTQAALSSNGWGTNNTIPSNPANLTGIWPKYQVLDRNHDLDPEWLRLPAGSPYGNVGADITRLKSVMGFVDAPAAHFAADNSLKVSWLAPDAQACTVDFSAPGQLYGTFTRSKLDTGGGRSRKITIPASNFTANTNYDVRINCERYQPVLHVRSN